jgi:hypothetical protein
MRPTIFTFFYHIPSAMTEGKWNTVQTTLNNEKSAAQRAIIAHYRGSEYPSQVEIWLKRKMRTAPNGAPSKVKKFLCKEKDKWVYEATRILEGETEAAAT